MRGKPIRLDSTYIDGEIKTTGFKHLKKVKFDPLPIFEYSFEHFNLTKCIVPIKNENATVILYRFLNKWDEALKVKFTPWIALRRLDELIIAKDHKIKTKIDEDTIIFSSVKERDLYGSITIPNAKYISEERWERGITYEYDREFLVDPREPLWVSGSFETIMDLGETIIPIIITGGNSEKIVLKILERVRKILKDPFEDFCKKQNETYVSNFNKYLEMKQKPIDPEMKLLIDSAMQYIVKRLSTGNLSIMEGYPMLEDNGRAAMISFTGLTLVTNRFKEAKEILRTYAKYLRFGLIPNHFRQRGIKPVYDSADASLWFIINIWKYLKYTGDIDFVKNFLWDKITNIVESYMEGTRFNIHLDHDGLVTIENDKIPLTWMDATIDGKPAIQRIGKPIEINALWYSSLRCASDIANIIGEDPQTFKAIADWTYEGFHDIYWYEEGGYLYDSVSDDFEDKTIRPNMIFPAALPFPILDMKSARSIIDVVKEHLLTSRGIRTLSPKDEQYEAKCSRLENELLFRGAAWPWLIGPFIDAFLYAYGRTTKNKKFAYTKFFKPLLETVYRGALGTVSQAYCGEYPHNPCGTPSYAMNVAELIRVYFESLQ